MAKKQKFKKDINIVPKTKNQKLLFDSIKTHPLTVVIGPAGTGKTYMAAMLAAKALEKGDVEKIILTRPNVDAGDPIGHLPGTQEEKLRYWLSEPLRILKKSIGESALEYNLKHEIVQLVPFQKMRGLTFEDAWIIADECQNTTERQMEMFTTRIGENVRVVIDGDVTQDDLRGRKTGITTLLQIIEDYNMDVPVIQFETDDILRSGLCKDFVISWHKYKKNANI